MKDKELVKKVKFLTEYYKQAEKLLKTYRGLVNWLLSERELDGK